MSIISCIFKVNEVCDENAQSAHDVQVMTDTFDPSHKSRMVRCQEKWRTIKTLNSNKNLTYANVKHKTILMVHAITVFNAQSVSASA